MQFIDYVKVHVKAGDGGNGCIAFRREKFVPLGGPSGGNGGKGGDVVFEADPQLATLLDQRMQSNIKAKRGGHGEGSSKTGRHGDDIVVRLPLGSVITEGDCVLGDLTEVGQRVIVAHGGDGGKGNQHFATARNRVPRKAQPGFEGEEKNLVIELKQIADIGFVGLPNAGKSTLLRRMTAATPKVAPYPFTTLHPNLGVMEDMMDEHITLADLPGLIEGASRGEGLGHRFLRHVERTKILAQLVAFEEAGSDYDSMRYQYDLIGDELAAYTQTLAEKKRLLILSKSDLIDPESRQEIVEKFRQEGFDPICLSSETAEGVEEFKKTILDLFAEIRKKEKETVEIDEQNSD